MFKKILTICQWKENNNDLNRLCHLCNPIREYGRHKGVLTGSLMLWGTWSIHVLQQWPFIRMTACNTTFSLKGKWPDNRNLLQPNPLFAEGQTCGNQLIVVSLSFWVFCDKTTPLCSFKSALISACSFFDAKYIFILTFESMSFPLKWTHFHKLGQLTSQNTLGLYCVVLNICYIQCLCCLGD